MRLRRGALADGVRRPVDGFLDRIVQRRLAVERALEFFGGALLYFAPTGDHGQRMEVRDLIEPHPRVLGLRAGRAGSTGKPLSA